MRKLNFKYIRKKRVNKINQWQNTSTRKSDILLNANRRCFLHVFMTTYSSIRTLIALKVYSMLDPITNLQ